MNLATVAYPKVSTSDYERIQRFRQDNDQYYSVVAPHLTLVFPLSEWTLETYLAEIEKQVEGIQAFYFCLRCAVLNKDAFHDLYHVLLVPDEGFSRVVKLHDQLLSGRLFPYRSLQIDFIPHIGIGNSKDPLVCLKMIEAWNDAEFAIPGHVSALDIVNYENNKVETVANIALGA